MFAHVVLVLALQRFDGHAFLIFRIAINGEPNWSADVEAVVADDRNGAVRGQPTLEACPSGAWRRSFLPKHDDVLHVDALPLPTAGTARAEIHAFKIGHVGLSDGVINLIQSFKERSFFVHDLISFLNESRCRRITLCAIRSQT